MPIDLSLATLADLPAGIGRPGYARADLSAGILHFGLGNFHRAHQAMTLDRLFSMGEGRDWAIVGAGVFEGERRGRDVLAAQDWLTTLVEQDAQTSTARVIGSMIDYIEPADADAHFTDAFPRWLGALWRGGTAATLRTYLDTA